jgi:hypothetical protein
MLNWIMTVVVVLIGFLVMVTGLIEYLFMGYLLPTNIDSFICFSRIWLCFHTENDK